METASEQAPIEPSGPISGLTGTLAAPPERRRAAVLVLAHVVLLGVARATILVTGLSMLVATLGIQLLPAIFLAAGVLTGILALPLQLMRDRSSPGHRLLVLLVPLLVLVAAAWIADPRESGWSVLTLALTAILLSLLPEPLLHELGAQTLDSEPGAPLYELLSAAGLAAFALTSLLLPILLQLYTVADLVLLGLGSLLLALLPLAVPAASPQVADPGNAPVRWSEPRMRFGGRTSGYLLLCLGLSILSLVVGFSVDLAFLSELSRRYPDNVQGFAVLLAGLLGACALLTLAGRRGTGLLLRRLGAPVIVQSMPFLVGIPVAAAVLVLLLGGGAALLFAVVMVLKLVDMVVRGSIGRAAVPALLQPLTRTQRAAAAPLLLWVVPALAALLAGAILLLIISSSSMPLMLLLSVLLLLVALWAGMSLSLSSSYLEMLGGALARRRLGGILAHWFQEESALTVVRRGLASDRPAEVVYCLDLLLKRGDAQTIRQLPELLCHPAAEVRREVLRQLMDLAVQPPLDEVRRLLEEDPAPEVRGAAARTLCSLGELGDLDEVAPLLRSRHRPIRLGALAGLLSSGAVEPMLIAGEELQQLMESADPEERLLAAEVLGEVDDQRHHRFRAALLNDDDRRVRRAALHALAIADPCLWPSKHDVLAGTIANLGRPGSATAAAAALVAAGDGVVGALIDACQDTQSRDLRNRILAVLIRIGGSTVQRYLWKQLESSDCETRHRLLIALAPGGPAAAESDADTVHRLIERELAAAAWDLSTLQQLDDGNEPLLGAIDRETRRCRHRLTLLSCLLEQPPAELQRLLDCEQQEVPTLLAEHHPQETMSLPQRLCSLVSRSEQLVTTWTRACALYCMADMDGDSVLPAVCSAVTDPQPLLRETALWVLTRLDPSGAREHLERACSDEARPVAAVARRLLEELP